MRIVLHEQANATGELVVTELSMEDGVLALATGSDVLPLPEGALDAVMKRYGKPLAIGDIDVRDIEGLRATGVGVAASLDLGDGRALVRFRFLRRYDVIARDYVALFAPGETARCELATAVTAALDHLARSLAARATDGS